MEGSTLYSAAVMRAKSSSPPRELPTMSGKGLGTSNSSTLVSVWGRKEGRQGRRLRISGGSPFTPCAPLNQVGKPSSSPPESQPSVLLPHLFSLLSLLPRFLCPLSFSLSASLCLSISISHCLCLCLALYLSLSPSLPVSVSLCICLCLYLYLSLSPSLTVSVSLSLLCVCLCICCSLCLYLSVSVFYCPFFFGVINLVQSFQFIPQILLPRRH